MSHASSMTDREFLEYEARMHAAGGATVEWSERFGIIADRLAALEAVATAADDWKAAITRSDATLAAYSEHHEVLAEMAAVRPVLDAARAWTQIHANANACAADKDDAYRATRAALDGLTEQPAEAVRCFATDPMSKRWIVYDPNGYGIDEHETEAEAVDAANDIISQYLDDTWDEEVTGVFVAEVRYVVVENRKSTKGDPDWDEVSGGRTDIEWFGSYDLAPLEASDAG